LSDLFNNSMPIEYFFNLPAPLLTDLKEARINYLQEKAKAEKEAAKKAAEGKKPI